MSDWSTAPLPEVLEFREGPGIMAADFRDGGVPLIRLAGLKLGANLLNGCNYLDPAKVEQKWKQFRLRKGDVLLSTSASLGEVATVVDEGVGAVPYTGIICFRPRDCRVDPRFIQHMLRTPSFKNQIEAMGVGSVMKHFGPSHLRSMTVSYPGVRTQRAIADVLGALDDKIAANNRLSATARSLADAIFMKSLRQGFGTPMTLGELASRGVLTLGDGYRTKRAEHGWPGYRILRAGDVRDGRIAPEGDDFVSKSYAGQIGSKLSQPGDIILTTKGSVGRVAVVPPDLEVVVYSPQICYFRVLDKEMIDSSYLASWFRSSDLQAQASQLMFKSDMAPYINLRDIRTLVVPVPGKIEQCKQVEVQRGLLDVVHAAHSENKRLGRTRDELLPLLMSGKARVREAEKVVEGVV
ncbi:restriction endonuclease subunit S [Amycolatopsis sp. AA4]|nr:restriction endonuclease subunit S [Amycolatopsis sp. AA4]